MPAPALLPAVRLLTRLPVGRHTADADLRPALGWLPVVGAVVACVAVAVRVATAPLVGPGPATIAAVLATVAVTGALHEDGLADTADGLWGGRDPAARLAIMRDSRLGTYALVAVVGDLALRCALLAPLGGGAFTRGVVAMEVVGRTAAPVLLASTPAARGDGLGADVGRPTRGGLLLAVATGVGTAAVVLGAAAPIALAVAAGATLVVRRVARTRLGGVTGDVLGAGIRVAALGVLVVAVAAARHGLLPEGSWPWGG